jgi:hypothetical protein
LEIDQPVKVAFCRLLHAANGGRFTPLGMPIFEEGIVGNCNDPYDCRTCVLMQSWLVSLSQGYIISWECQACLRDTEKIQRILPGHYQEGFCDRCGFETPLLQVVLRQEALPPYTPREG